MKSCKKILLLVIALVLAMNINVKAADFATEPSDTVTDDVTLTASVTEAKVGDKVTITVRAKCSTGIGGVDATLDWDDAKLDFSNEGNFQLSGLDETTGEFVFSVLYDGDELEDDVATLEFTVLETATVGEKLKVSLSDMNIINYDYEDIAVEDKEVIITVIGEGETPGGDEGEEGTPGGNEGEGEKPGGNEGEGEKPGGNEGEGEKPGGNEGEGEKPGGNQGESEKPGEDQGEQKPSDDKDDTTADKEINNAGLQGNALILITTGIVVIALYIKCKKYSDVI